MKKITVADIVKEATKEKPLNVRHIHSFASKNYPEAKIRIKDINSYLYSEYYDNIPYGSVERFEKL